jgi:Kef-type K+ transport system membrane component KefB
MSVRSAIQPLLVVAGALLLGVGLALSQSVPGHLDEMGGLALGLTVVVAAGLCGGHLAGRFGQAAVLGELLPGMARLRFIGTDPYLDVLARIGMLLLLFEVGLDLSVRDLFTVGASSLLVAIIGTVSSLLAGTGAAALLMPAGSAGAHWFLGASLTATSVGITARALKDMGASRSIEAQIVLGAAVVDDVLGLVVLGVIAASLASNQGAAATWQPSIAALVMKSVGFLVLAIVLGTQLTPTWFRRAAGLRTKGALLGVGLCFCFLLSWAASRIGLAALVGAFAAGLVLEEAHSEMFVQRGEQPLGELLQPMTAFLVPVFFVLVGFRASLRALAQPALVALPLGLTVAAIAGKLSCAAGVFSRGASRLTVAIGMIPRGEVALVFAALGSTLGTQTPLLDERGYTAIVAVVILTTLVTPVGLKWSLGRAPGARGVTEPAA